MSDASRSHLYGAGVFTTIRIVDGEPWLWDKHWRRLTHDAAKLGIDMSMYSEHMVRCGIDETIPDVEKRVPQKLRITISDIRRSPLWSDEEPPVPTGIEFLRAPLRKVARPFRLGISPHAVSSTSPIVRLKTCNYLDPTLALRESMEAGFYESLRVNERGHVTSACMANVFWLRDGQLCTPSLTTGCLQGTTREFVMENVDVTEVEAQIGELQLADAVFLTSAGLGLVQVDEFDGRAMESVEHAILGLIPGNG